MKTLVASISFTCGALVTVFAFLLGLGIGMTLEKELYTKEEKGPKVVNIGNGMK